jgi:hypothetical protein
MNKNYKPKDNPSSGLSVKIRKVFRIKQKKKQKFSFVRVLIKIEVTILLFVHLWSTDPSYERTHKDEIHLLNCKTWNMFLKTNEEASASFLFLVKYMAETTIKREDADVMQ